MFSVASFFFPVSLTLECTNNFKHPIGVPHLLRTFSLQIKPPPKIKDGSPLSPLGQFLNTHSGLTHKTDHPISLYHQFYP